MGRDGRLPRDPSLASVTVGISKGPSKFENDMEFMASRILLCFQGVIRRTIQAYKKGVPYCANATNNLFQ